MIDPLLVGGLVIACFVAYDIGGATTEPAFGPAVGAGVISKTVAGGLMSVCFFLGAWTIGRRVVDTSARNSFGIRRSSRYRPASSSSSSSVARC